MKKILLSLSVLAMLSACGSQQSNESQLLGRGSQDGVTAELKRIFNSATKISGPGELSRVPTGEICILARDAFDSSDDPRTRNYALKASVSSVPFGQGFRISDAFESGPASFFVENGDASSRFVYYQTPHLFRARLTSESALVLESLAATDRNYGDYRMDPSQGISGYSVIQYILMTGRPVNGVCPAIN